MKQLRQALRPFNDRGVSVRIEPNNRMFITGLDYSEVTSIKDKKPLLILILPEGKNFTISQILQALARMIQYSEGLVVDAGYELHSADLKALSIGHYYFKSLDAD